MGSRGFGSWYRRARSRFWWIQYFRDGRRRRESVGSDKEKDAKDLLKRRLGEIDRDPSSTPTLTVGDLYVALERDYVIQRKKSVRNVRSVWKHHLQPAFGAIAAAELSTDRISLYIAG